jgi:hypothetical protein
MIDQATKAVCVVAAITSLIFACTRTCGLHSSDLPVLALVVAPNYGSFIFRQNASQHPRLITVYQPFMVPKRPEIAERVNLCH